MTATTSRRTRTLADGPRSGSRAGGRPASAARTPASSRRSGPATNRRSGERTSSTQSGAASSRSSAGSARTRSASTRAGSASGRTGSGSNRTRSTGRTVGRATAPRRSRASAPASARNRRRIEAPSRRRIGVLAAAVGVVAVALIARIVWVGVIGRDQFVDFGRSKRERVVRLTELRGAILDRDGEALVMSVPAKLVAVDPTVVENADRTATSLASILGLPRAQVLAAVERPDTRYAVIARQVDPTQVDKIRAAKLTGIVLEDDPKRVSVSGNLARSVVGSMDRYGTEARSGVERLFDTQLAAKSGEKRVERAIGGAVIPGSERVVSAARAGADVTLTLDRSLQFAAEEALIEQVGATQARGGTVILGRPRTGEILAMASASRTEEGEVVAGSLNQAVRQYEPGSIMKLATASMAFNEGLLTPASTLVVPGAITLYDKTIQDAHAHPTEVMTVKEIIANSSNVGTIKMAQMVEKERSRQTIIDYLHRFGFGSYTNLGLPFEQKGIVKEKWNGTDIASIPIGQSILTTPVQMWTAYNAIANGGLYVPPKLVLDMVDAEGRHHVPDAPRPHQVVKPSTAAQVTEALRSVVDEGTGKDVQIEGFNVAAKTGTAYKVLSNGTYKDANGRKYASSFVGFFPASAPEISIMVMIDEPKPPYHYGSAAAGPVFERLAKEAVRRFAIPSDHASSGETKPLRAEPATATPVTAPPVTVPTKVIKTDDGDGTPDDPAANPTDPPTPATTETTTPTTAKAASKGATGSGTKSTGTKSTATTNTVSGATGGSTSVTGNRGDG